MSKLCLYMGSAKNILFRILIFVILISNSLTCSTKEIAITIDDLPFVGIPKNTSYHSEGLIVVQNIIKSLHSHQITATGFVVGKQVNKNTLPALQAFINAGHNIGNHSWTHADYNKISIEQFEKETQRTHKLIKHWIKKPFYYRFPYLREGLSIETKQRATEVLSSLDYQNTPVSIDNDEWKFNSEYINALEKGEHKNAQKIAQEYIQHMKERTLFFQQLAKKKLGRDVKHILLLHMNKINADQLHNLLTWYSDNNWNFVTVEEALTDPLYSTPDSYIGERGLSKIERIIALEK